jgi:hypothetical protein
MDKLYVGWTKPGEWINYTVNVNESGRYTMSLLYTPTVTELFRLMWMGAMRQVR